MEFSRQEYWSGLAFPSPSRSHAPILGERWLIDHQSQNHRRVGKGKQEGNEWLLAEEWREEGCCWVFKSFNDLPPGFLFSPFQTHPSCTLYSSGYLQSPYAILVECEVKWTLGSITMNKASGGDRIPVSYFKS